MVAPEIERIGANTPDSELVAAVRAGDDQAFAELYRRHQPSVARFVRRRVGDEGRSEDVVQECFVSALRRMRQTDSELAFRPWIFEIARNASIDAHRRALRRDEVSIDAGTLRPADTGRLQGSPAPDALLLGKESFDHFRGALDELSDAHHRIIVLRELEGRSYREIGERMELSQAAVESTLFRARRRLALEYEELDSGERCRVVGAAIGRLAEGVNSSRDVVALDRHARRCSACRRQARLLGVEPLLAGRRRRITERVAALLPAPGLLHRGTPTGRGGVMEFGLGPSAEASGSLVAKAAAVVAALALVGGGAVVGGARPFSEAAPDATPSKGKQGERAPGGSRRASPAGRRRGSAAGRADRRNRPGRGSRPRAQSRQRGGRSMMPADAAAPRSPSPGAEAGAPVLGPSLLDALPRAPAATLLLLEPRDLPSPGGVVGEVPWAPGVAAPDRPKPALPQAAPVPPTSPPAVERSQAPRAPRAHGTGA